LGTIYFVEEFSTSVGGTVINIFVRLAYPNKLFARVIEVEFDLVRGRSNGFITSELKLLNEVFVRVLGHSATLIGIKEDIINVKGSSYKRLVVGSTDLLVVFSLGKFFHCP
jgi:hypothetical protein